MGLYLKFFSMHFKCQMQYKASFFMTMLGQFLVSFSTFLGVYFMFLRFNTVQGFTFEQVLLCFGTLLMSFSLAEMFGRGFDTFPTILGNGEFDRMLVRPKNIVYQVLMSKFEFTRIGRLIQSLIVFAYAIPYSEVLWSFDKILILLLMIVCGAVVFFCLFVVYAAFAFFTLEGLEFMNVFTDGGREFGRYPFKIYGDKVLKFLTFVIPLALFQYYPLLYILGKSSSILHMLAPLFSLLFIIPSLIFFRFGLRRYKSTGS